MMMNVNEENGLLHKAIIAAIEGGERILEIYREDFSIAYKADHSPLTLADQKAHEAISSVLKATGLPVLSEEGKNIPFEVRKDWRRFWLVDPLDGTKEFIKRNGEFTVNIALIEDGNPVLGVILVPVSGLLYFASLSGGAFKIPITRNNARDLRTIIANAESMPLENNPPALTVVCSRSHLSPETAEYIDKLRRSEPGLDFISIGSSLKLCMVAEGKAQIYPRFGPTMEWDTAAGHAILTASGGKVLQVGSQYPVIYNKPQLLNPWFIASRPR
jgi:3'(2'), 5'-bisphosphate nucleotidase